MKSSNSRSCSASRTAPGGMFFRDVVVALASFALMGGWGLGRGLLMKKGRKGGGGHWWEKEGRGGSTLERDNL